MNIDSPEKSTTSILGRLMVKFATPMELHNIMEIPFQLMRLIMTKGVVIVPWLAIMEMKVDGGIMLVATTKW